LEVTAATADHQLSLVLPEFQTLEMEETVEQSAG
jgi:hypothetical protein